MAITRPNLPPSPEWEFSGARLTLSVPRQAEAAELFSRDIPTPHERILLSAHDLLVRTAQRLGLDTTTSPTAINPVGACDGPQSDAPKIHVE